MNDLIIPAGDYARNFRHGHKTAVDQSPEYTIWNNLKSRCNNPKNNRYHRYGGRGISVCESWATDFMSFLNDMGRRPSSYHTLDRIDNDGNYCKENCQWSTRKEQARNRTTSSFLEFEAMSKTKAEWAEIYGLNQSTLHLRIKNGWSVERALKTPVQRKIREPK